MDYCKIFFIGKNGKVTFQLKIWDTKSDIEIIYTAKIVARGLGLEEKIAHENISDIIIRR